MEVDAEELILNYTVETPDILEEYSSHYQIFQSWKNFHCHKLN